ncbi:MAG TPA: hypothetical protein VKG80_10390 [Trebonia sp.]|nr:hypothetical protein [Trebonia sp.]
MKKPSARERFADTAFELFDERGYEQTTVAGRAYAAGYWPRKQRSPGR